MISTEATAQDVGEALPEKQPALAAIRRLDDTLVVMLGGAWDMERPTPRFDRVIGDGLDTARASSAVVRAIGFDATALGPWDSSLLTFLLQGLEYCRANALAFEEAGLPERIARLIALARAVPERQLSLENAPASLVARLGHASLGRWQALMEAVAFTGEVTASFSRLMFRRAKLRRRDFWLVVQSNSSGALPIVTLIALLVGVIIAFLGVVVLQRFGAGYYVSYLVGYGVLREMGALMTGIILAGRTGAAFAAELGSMKINEEIDAYSTLGVSPVEYLVLPRMLGLFIMMPLLTIYADFIGIAGGMVVAVTLLDLSATQFVGGLLTAVTLSDGLLGIFKATIFGLIIGFAGCLKGLQTGSDAGAVGRSATSAVVLAITLIIAFNALVDWLAALLGS